MNSIKNIFKLSGLNLLKHKKIEKRDEFWFNNPFILIDPNRLDEFFPSKVMTLEEQINAMIRLLAYISVFLMLYSGNSNYLYLLIFALVISYIVYKYSDNISVGKVKKEDFMSNYDSNKNYILPLLFIIAGPARSRYACLFSGFAGERWALKK